MLPRALCDENGMPNKSSKSHWTDKLQKPYQLSETRIVTYSLQCLPQAVIIDAMFMLNTKPLRRTNTIAEYSKLLFHQYILHHFKTGICEVHLVFDSPCRNSFNPKIFEQDRWYKKTFKMHEHCHFDVNTDIPPFWQELSECLTCKWAIVKAIGFYFLQSVHTLLQGQQHLVIAGCFDGNCAWSIRAGTLPERVVAYDSNASEADYRIWHHAAQKTANIILPIQTSIILG